MKKLLTILFLIPMFLAAQNELKITKMFVESQAYKTHFVNDGGTMDAVNSDIYLKSAYYQSIDDEMQTSIEFSYLGTAATSIRESGIYRYVEKAYDTSTSGNDATQTTESSQPYETGNIAPTEHLGMQNPNGDARYITHPEISFAADEAWSVTMSVNTNGIGIGNIYPVRNATTLVYLSLSGNYRLRLATGGNAVSFNVFSTLEIIGKNSVVTITYDNGTVNGYINGVKIQDALTMTPSIASFTGFIYLDGSLTGRYNAHIIRNIALDSTQVSNEANLLLAIYPPIAYKTIETYNISTTSLDIVASSNGTVIAMATDNTDWATGAARWRYYSDDSEIGSWGNKLYNKAARDVIIANPPDGWHVATEAELTIIAAIDGDKLKVEGTDYWTTANGTNSTGLSAVGSGIVNTDGTFTGINTTVGFWCADSDKALIITDAGAATITSVSANEGYSIRLIQD